MFRRIAGVFSAGVVAATLVVVASAGPAAAAGTPVNLTCDAFLYTGSSVDTSGTPVQAGIAQAIELGALSGPTEVNAGSSFTVSSPSTSKALPDSQPSPLGTATVKEVKNVDTTVVINGAAAVGAVTTAGGNVQNPSVTKSGNTLHLELDGSQSGSQIPAGGGGAGANFFPGGSNLVTPSLNIGLTAGAAGSSISATVTHQELDVVVHLDALGDLGVRLVCDADPNSLGTVQVVTPPPPGAPNAVADVVSTKQNTLVTISVLANDTPDAQRPIDEDSLAITEAPGNGTAKVNDDHTITYTPNAGTSGNDAFTYQLCSSEPEQPAAVDTTVKPAAVAAPCDTAVVTINVDAGVVVKPGATTPTTAKSAAAATTTTTVAAELPRTGSGSTPMSVLGFALLGLGGAALAIARRRPRGAM